MTKGTSSFGKRHNKTHTVHTLYPFSIQRNFADIESCVDDAVNAHCTFKNTPVQTVVTQLPKSESVCPPLEIVIDRKTIGVLRRREERQLEPVECDTSRL
jgi:hypothetical protein